jgi:hypothetical protein
MSRTESGHETRRSRWRWAPVALACAGALAVGFARPSWASDHEDAPSLAGDPAVDIADVFAFVRPGSTSHMVLSMTVHPGANGAAVFATGVEYVFRLVGYDAAARALDPSVADIQVACRFQAPQAGSQVVVCSANGVSSFATLGQTDSGADDAPLRIFAGLRADPAFGDVERLKTTLATGQLAFVEAGATGTNTFANRNVLALVVEVDIDAVLFPGRDPAVDRPLLAVSGHTERL